MEDVKNATVFLLKKFSHPDDQEAQGHLKKLLGEVGHGAEEVGEAVTETMVATSGVVAVGE